MLQKDNTKRHKDTNNTMDVDEERDERMKDR